MNFITKYIHNFKNSIFTPDNLYYADVGYDSGVLMLKASERKKLLFLNPMMFLGSIFFPSQLYDINYNQDKDALESYNVDGNGKFFLFINIVTAIIILIGLLFSGFNELGSLLMEVMALWLGIYFVGFAFACLYGISEYSDSFSENERDSRRILFKYIGSNKYFEIYKDKERIVKEKKEKEYRDNYFKNNNIETNKNDILKNEIRKELGRDYSIDDDVMSFKEFKEIRYNEIEEMRAKLKDILEFTKYKYEKEKNLTKDYDEYRKVIRSKNMSEIVGAVKKIQKRNRIK